MSLTLRDRNIDSFKGVLICLIVLGHNYFFSKYYPLALSFIYNFHVVSFLLLPFLFLKKEVSLGVLVDKLFRLMGPQGVFLLITAAVYIAVNVYLSEDSLLAWLNTLPSTLLLQRESTFRDNLGAGFLWFLPALALQTVLLFFYQNGAKSIRFMFVLLVTLIHFGLGLAESKFMFQLPFSVSLISYIFVLGVVIHALYQKLTWSTTSTSFIMLLWFLMTWLCIKYELFSPLAGDFYAAPLSAAEPLKLAFQDTFIVVTFFFLLRISRLLSNRIIDTLGVYSLQIFLLHPFVWQAQWRLGLNSTEELSDSMTLLITMGSYIMTLGITFTLIKAFEYMHISEWLFPMQKKKAV